MIWLAGCAPALENPQAAASCPYLQLLLGALRCCCCRRAGGWKALFGARRGALAAAAPWQQPSTFEVEASGAAGLPLAHSTPLLQRLPRGRSCPRGGGMQIGRRRPLSLPPPLLTSHAVDMLAELPPSSGAGGAEPGEATTSAAEPAAEAMPAAEAGGGEIEPAREAELCLVFLVDGSGGRCFASAGLCCPSAPGRRLGAPEA